MNNQSYGQVVPFALPASKLRRSAAMRRKNGQPVEALELQRRAAWEGDLAMDWLTLASMLREQSCWEQATDLLQRLLTRQDAPPEAWWELGCCFQATNQRELAAECLYHYLMEDPYAPMADHARSMLAELEHPGKHAEPGRLNGLVRRGLQAWRQGERELGMKRLRRAIRLSSEPMRLHMTIMMLYMAEADLFSALQEAGRALRCNPEHPRCLTTLAVLLHQLGKRRMALAFLRRSIPHCQSVAGEDVFLSAAWTMNANHEMAQYLRQMLQRYPNRISLLHAQAWLAWEKGRRDEALRLWKHVLRLNAEDHRAQTLLRYAPTSPDAMMPMEALLPQESLRLSMVSLQEAVAQGVAPQEIVRHGSSWRVALDLCMATGGEYVQKIVLKMLSGSDHPAVIRYLRELLMLPSMELTARQQVLMRMAELGQQEEMLMLMGQRITSVQCQRVEEGSKQLSLWRAFLPSLLHETRRWRCSPEIAAFAADLWPQMSRSQRQTAASPLGYAYIKAVEWLYLYLSGRTEDALQALDDVPVSLRRIRRIVRLLAGLMQRTPAFAGTINTEELKDELHQF